MKLRDQYIIQFGGLKEGKHSFNFEIGNKFFEEYSEIGANNGQLKVLVQLIKKQTFLSLEISIDGILNLICDRCLDNYQQKIEYTGSLYVKFSSKKFEEDDEDIIYLAPEENSLDLKHYLYESIYLSIPLKKTHPEIDGKVQCNLEMLKYLEMQNNIHNNPLWDKLKELKKKHN